METYVSIDIETDGPCPGVNSMLSLGAAAFDDDGRMFDTFYMKLKPLPDAVQNEHTMTSFWDKNPKAWKEVNEDKKDADLVMSLFFSWTVNLPGKPIFLAYPAGFDFTFVYWYFHKFLNKCPYGFSALDIKTYAMAILDKPYGKCFKRDFPKSWIPEGFHTHIAIDDAIEQGEMFFLMKKWKEKLAKTVK